jgi:HK97 family phage major capsid protein/HK97 family phage prohead protease
MNSLQAKYVPKGTRIIASTDKVDRDGEVVIPKGCTNLDTYLSDNPVVLFGHKWDQPPVGRATSGQIHEDRIELTIDWAPTEAGQELKKLYDNGYMNSFSIGFIPHEREQRKGVPHYTKWEMLEVSAVPIPSNRYANVIRQAAQDGFQVKHLKGMFEDNAQKIYGVSVDEFDRIANKTSKEYDMTDTIALEREIDELKQKLVSVRDAGDQKLADLKAQMKMGQFADDATIEVTGPNYRGVNLKAAGEAFLGLKDRDGDPQRLEGLMKTFTDMSYMTKDATMVEGTPAAGGYLTPDDRAQILHYARQSSVALRNARSIAMGSDKMKVPAEDAKLSLAFSNEATAATETSATFTEVELSTTDLDGYVDVSSHLEADSDVPLAALLLDQFLEAYAGKIDSAVFVGEGDPVSGTFLGFGQSVVFGAGSTHFSELITANLFSAVSKLPTYRRNGAKWYIGRDNLWTYVNQLKDEQDRYLFISDPSTTSPGKILGYQVEEIEYYPTTAASTAMALYANLKSFIIGDRLTNMTMFRDPYSLSTYHHVRYVFWTRVAFANGLPNDQVAIVTAGE